jgi:hypothetical protein
MTVWTCIYSHQAQAPPLNLENTLHPEPHVRLKSLKFIQFSPIAFKNQKRSNRSPFQEARERLDFVIELSH